jgi:hypothetical protein
VPVALHIAADDGAVEDIDIQQLGIPSRIQMSDVIH